MAENSKIEWTDHTFNPWTGCTKVSPGCDHCYAEGWAKRSGTVRWGAGEPRRRTTEVNWRQPVKWNRLSENWVANGGKRARVFCSSLADVFDNEVPPEWRADLFRLIAATPHLDWLLLTKRIGNAKDMIFEARKAALLPGELYWPPVLENVWVGSTVVNQEEADRDIPKLLQVPARVRFLSIEPMLGPIDLRQISLLKGEMPDGLKLVNHPCDLDALAGLTVTDLGIEYSTTNRINWVICGGESGPGARPMHPEWVRSLREQCAEAGTPFLFKQWGEWTPGENVERVRGTIDTAFLHDDGWHVYPLNLATDHGHIDDQPDLYRVGKKAAGRLLDGMQHDGFPEVASCVT